MDRPTPGPSAGERERFLEVALEATGEAAALIRTRAGAGFTAKAKPDGSIVTNVDIEVETLLRHAITAAFPSHSITGEELPPLDTGSDYRWYIDPIDGTADFARGIPLYGTLLCLCHGDRPIAAVIRHPGLGIVSYATLGGGAFSEGRRLRIRIPSLGDALDDVIAAGEADGFRQAGLLTRYRQLLNRHPRVRTVSGCFGHTLVARGAIGGMIDTYVSYWDYGAGVLLIRESGGRVSLFDGRSLPDGRPTRTMVCGTPRTVEWLLALFRD
jgi:histidinol-phosphatase